MAFTEEPFAQAATDWDLERLYADLASAKQQVAPHKKKGLTEVEKLHLRGLLCGYSPAEIASRLIKTAKGVEVDLSNTIYRYVETLTGRSANTLENWRDIFDWLEAAGYKREASRFLTNPRGTGVPPVVSGTGVPPVVSGTGIPPVVSGTGVPPVVSGTGVPPVVSGTGIPPVVSGTGLPPVVSGTGLPPVLPPQQETREPAKIQNLQDWGEAPDVYVFYGRAEELTTLKQWIVNDRCRLVALLGMGGIGKTALSVKLAEEIQGEFDYLIWRSLRHAPPVEDTVASLIKFFSAHQENTSDLSRLLDYLRTHRCLVVLDEPETILRPGNPVGHYREGYEGYGELLRRVGVERHNSCLVLTSREKPKEIASLEGDRLPVRSLTLGSLGEAAKEILREKGLLYEEEKWPILIRLYGGNPLALRMVSTTIRDFFGGRVADFLKQSTIFIGDIRQLLDQQFERLSDLEKKIMYELAIHPAPISVSQMAEDVSLTQSKSELIEALDSLGRRSLLERSTIESEVLFTLQPVVMKYVKKIYTVSS